MTNAEKFIAALVAPAQVLEDTQQQLLADNVNTASGVQLTTIGTIVGCPRDGISDDDVYRRRVRAAIAANKSDGLVEDMLTIANLIVFDPDAEYVLRNDGIAAFRFRVDGIILDTAVAVSLLKYLRRAVAGGVRIIVELLAVTEDECFAWGDSLGSDSPGLGWGDSLDVDTGGKFTSGM